MIPEITGVDVFDPAAGYVGSIGGPAAGGAYPVAFIDGQRFLAIAESEWGRTLEVWSITPG